jgi:hypothetical protein
VRLRVACFDRWPGRREELEAEADASGSESSRCTREEREVLVNEYKIFSLQETVISDFDNQIELLN